jgi:hypothetical protein
MLYLLLNDFIFHELTNIIHYFCSQYHSAKPKRNDNHIVYRSLAKNVSQFNCLFIGKMSNINKLLLRGLGQLIYCAMKGRHTRNTANNSWDDTRRLIEIKYIS